VPSSNDNRTGETVEPSPDTVVERRTFTPDRATLIAAAAAGSGAPTASYEIIRTQQVDEYDEPVTKAAAAAAPAAMAAAGDSFKGKDRKAAKLSISSKPVEQFIDIKTLIGSLAGEAGMINHDPEITRAQNSKRVKEERRNVRARAWIYAASREGDNDFHLIVGRDPTKSRMFVTMEISGLPPASAASRNRLEKVRDAYMGFFTDLPGTGYDFYKPPIPVEIGGSLFFDITHATGGRPGPKDLRPDMPVIWEVHPVTHLVFEP
jgi:hypothetical protein